MMMTPATDSMPKKLRVKNKLTLSNKQMSVCVLIEKKKKRKRKHLAEAPSVLLSLHHKPCA
jgi:hypothetical protein